VFGAQGYDSPVLDAKLLCGQALGLSTLEMAVRENDPVAREDLAQVELLMQRRLSGESVARIIGAREFYGLSFALGRATLEPRPETEMLVDRLIEQLPVGGRLLDLGTGTGCIPIAVLVNRPDAHGVAVDLSAEALQVAAQNAKAHGVAQRLELVEGSWFAPLAPAQKFHLIVSNPPYIVSAVVDTLAIEVRDFDPRLALDGGPDGLAPYRVIAAEAAHWLEPGGMVVLEIGYDQGAAVTQLMEEAGFDDVRVEQDLNGLDRMVVAHHL
jgi:release factor glutamine methyltransferase